MLKMIEKIELFDENRGSFSTWGSQIIINTALDYLRKNNLEMISLEELKEKGKELAIVESIETKSYETEESANNLKSLEFSAALSTLSDSEQRVINMALQNYSGKEAAGELGISEAAFRKRKERALEKFRNILITYPHIAEYADEGIDSQT